MMYLLDLGIQYSFKYLIIIMYKILHLQSPNNKYSALKGLSNWVLAGTKKKKKKKRMYVNSSLGNNPDPQIT